MIYKYLGSCLLVGSAVFYSWHKLRREKAYKKILNECIDLLRYIYRNIECFQKPLPEIIGEYKSKYLDFGIFFSAVKETNMASAAEKMKVYLPVDAYHVMEKYIQSAGKGYKDEELQLCKYTCDTLQNISEKLDEDSRNHAKITKTLPLMFALSVVLLFW